MITVQPTLRLYYLSKWTCPYHGHYTARTLDSRGPTNPVLCPECVPVFVDCGRGHTIQPVPFVSRPRIPKKTDTQPSVSGKAPLRKRGISW